jgi:hydroxypyruvate reductase
MPDATHLRSNALAIWRAGLAAVDSQRLVRHAFRVEGSRLVVGSEEIPLAEIRRIAVVGAGKAGAGMAAGVLEALGPDLAAQKQLVGWVNVPADCAGPLDKRLSAAPSPHPDPLPAGEGTHPDPIPEGAGSLHRLIHLHAARPAGVNEPTAAGVAGAEQILRLVAALGPEDLCVGLISGGGSALLPAPAAGLTLDDKLAVTRHLSAAGASIEELNTVRKQLSRIKGGGLARACRAGRLCVLVISDVLGDPLDLIASGPTVEDPGSAADALAVLEKYAAAQTGSPLPSRGGPGVSGVPARVFDYLRRPPEGPKPPPQCRVTNLIVGNNLTAVDAAGAEARRRGYSPTLTSAARSEGLAEEVGCRLAQTALEMRGGARPDCLISGGEPVVRLVPAPERGLGGRNQQLALAALEQLAGDGAEGIALLSGGTDGEDGPTDAAGALVDAQIIRAVCARDLDPADFLARNDAYRFFDAVGGLIKTGPTHTNVCDVRVVLVARGA